MSELLIGLLSNRRALGHYEDTITTATPASLPGWSSLSAQDKARVKRVVIRPRVADIAYTDDGTTVTSTHGMPILMDEVLMYDGIQEAFEAWRGIAISVSATVHVAYYGAD